MKNPLSYFGLVDAKIRASDKDSPAVKSRDFFHAEKERNAALNPISALNLERLLSARLW